MSGPCSGVSATKGPYVQGLGASADAWVVTWSGKTTWRLSGRIADGPASAGQVTALAYTLNNANVMDCKDYPGFSCSPGGVYRASRVTLTIAAPPNYHVANPTVSCDGDPGCEFLTGNPALISPSRTSASVSRKAWGLPVFLILQARIVP